MREYWKLVPSKTRWIFDIGKLIFILENNFVFSVLCSCLGSLMSKHFRFSFTLHHIAPHSRKINLHKTNNRTHTHTAYRVQAIKHTNFMLRIRPMNGWTWIQMKPLTISMIANRPSQIVKYPVGAVTMTTTMSLHHSIDKFQFNHIVNALNERKIILALIQTLIFAD